MFAIFRGSVFERPNPPILSNYLKIKFGAAEDFFQNQVLKAIFFIEDEHGCRSKEPDYHVSVRSRRGERVRSLAQEGAFENQNAVSIHSAPPI